MNTHCSRQRRLTSSNSTSLKKIDGLIRETLYLICLISLEMVNSCSPAAPQEPRYIDEMHFAEDDSPKTEPLQRGPDKRSRRGGLAQPRPRKKSPGQNGARQSWAPPKLPAPRCARPKTAPSRSLGRATHGTLQNGCLLPKKGRGYLRLRGQKGWGTDGMVAALQWALAETSRLHRGSVPVLIGALSRPKGGPLRPYQSHQNGRDVNIGYFASNNIALTRFQSMRPDNIDLEKTWTLMAALLRTGQVQYIFVDYELQALLMGWLQDQDADPVILGRLFQFPAGRSARRGILRHVVGHDDHFQVRFLCQPADGPHCQN